MRLHDKNSTEPGFCISIFSHYSLYNLCYKALLYTNDANLTWPPSVMIVQNLYITDLNAHYKSKLECTFFNGFIRRPLKHTEHDELHVLNQMHF